MSVLLVVALVAAGLAWQECLLLTAAALAAQRLERWRAACSEPIDTSRIGARAIVAGGSGLLASVLLGAALLAAVAGWWQPSHDHPMLTVALIAAAGAVITAVQPSVERFRAEAALWLLSVLGATAGLLAAANGAAAAACVASATAVAYVAQTGWQLARDGSLFLRSD